MCGAVWACASIFHVPAANLRDSIFNISKALKPGGYSYASFKYGDFEGERNGGYFTDLTEESFSSLLEPYDQVEIVELEITGDALVGREDEKWLNV